ncbi:MAG: hypothetical protein AB8B97_09600 [Granulosicoccus sp.]
MSFPLVKLQRETGAFYEGQRPTSVKELIAIDMQGALDPMTLHEWLWDSLMIKTDTVDDLESLSKPLKEYVSVLSVKNYVDNGGIDAPLHYAPLTLPYAKDGFLAINCPVAAQAVDRMMCAVNYVLEINDTTLEKSDVSMLLYDLADEHDEKLSEILAPNGVEIDYSEFDAPEALAVYVRENYKYFLGCELPIGF